MADNWEAVSGYDTNDYTDAMIVEMDAGSKRFREISGQALVAGEKNSQYIRFMIPRYWDGIDVSEMNISIVYGLAGKYYGESDAVSVERTDDRLRFGWVVPEEACCIAGTLLFEIIIKNDAYTLKSQIVETIVFKSINIDDIAPEPTREAWYKEFQARVDQALTSAEDILSEAQDVVAEARAYVGAPLVARTADDFEDTDRIYVYTGSEEGYNTGHWYYWRGTAMAWTDGGVYNAVAVDTDTTLSIAGKAADAKEVGDQITDLKENFTDIINSAYVTDSDSGSVAHFVDGADNVPMKSVKVNIAPVQSGSGDPSPSNVRAISGWNSVNVYVSPTTDSEDATVYNISLSSAGTVYGGTLDVVSGELVVDRAIIDMGDMQWDAVTVSGTLLFRSASIASQIAANNDCISSMFAIVTNMTELRNTEASFIAKTSNWSSSNLRTAVHDSRYTDANEFKSAVTGQKIVYPLTEPQTIQLTPQQIKSLLGINNVWSDAGSVEVEYRADTKLYIDKRLGV